MSDQSLRRPAIPGNLNVMYPMPARWLTEITGTAVAATAITRASATACAAEPVSSAGRSLMLKAGLQR